MHKVITYGTFDLFHYGHLELLRRARQLGDMLIVGLSTDEFNQDQKNKISFHTYEQRKKNLEAIKYVDMIIPEENWEQKEEDVIKYGIDTFIIGDDWEGKFDFLKPFCQVIYLSRTPEVSSSLLRNAKKKDLR